MIIHDEDDGGKNENNNTIFNRDDDAEKYDENDKDDDDDNSWKVPSENLKSVKLEYLHIHRIKSEMWISAQNPNFITFHQY